MTIAVPPYEIRRALDVDTLLQEAREQAGLFDYGELGFVGPLRKIEECFSRETKFHADGLADFRKTLVRDLVNRLRIHEDLKRHPEILDEDVSDPIIVLGLPRSGTTKFQRMVGTDPNLLKTFMWQLLNPARFPGAIAGQPDPRIAAAASLDRLSDDNPEIRAAHVYAAELPQDDQWLLALTFNDDWLISGRTPCPSYEAWVTSRTEPSNLDNNRYARSVFQYLQWQQGGRQNRRWLMKNTVNVARLPELTVLYPKATYVHLHRHPREFMGSVCKLMLEVWPLRVVDVDPVELGAYYLKREKRALDIYLHTRESSGLDDRIVDVQYEQLRNNPMPAIREVYRRAGHVLAPESERGMMNWERENEQGKHGKHIYSLEQFGLSERKIEEAFGDYIERFLRPDSKTW